MTGRGHQLIHSDAFAAELEAIGLDQSIFGPHLPAPVFQALVPRKAGVFDEHAHTFGTGDEPATFARASDGLYRNGAGAWTIASAGAIRAEHSAAGAFLGYLFEPASTNEFLNSAAPITQNIALGTGTFTLSVHGSGSVTSANGTGTASGHGAATEGTHVTFIVSGAGTFSFTVAGGPPTYVQVEELAVPSSPIITQGTPETRAIDTLSWATVPAGFSNDAGVALLDATPQFAVGDMAALNYGLLTLTTSAISFLYMRPNAGNGELRAFDGANLATALFDGGGGPTSGSTYRVAARWNSTTGKQQVGIKNGTWSFGTEANYDGIYNNAATPDRLQVALTGLLPMTLKNLAIFNRDIGSAEIARLY